MPAHPPAKAAHALCVLIAALTLGLTGLSPAPVHAEGAAEAPDLEAFSGDVGLGVLRGASSIQGVQARTSAVPYLNFEKGRLFGRIDTFGVKTLPLGLGHLELLGQVRSDGYQGGGWSRRKDPVPLGLERQSSAYTRYYLGTTAADAAAAGRAYQPGAALNPYVGGLIELPVNGPWVLNLYLRRVFADRSLINSPLAGHGHRDTGLLALTYRY